MSHQGRTCYIKETMQTTATLIDVESVMQLTDDYLKAYCQQRSLEAVKLGASYVRLWQSIESVLTAGGKRLRPFMVLATYQAFRPNSDLKAILPAAVAHELIHAAMLIHDDIIDRDTVRHGQKNIAGQYDEHYGPFVGSGDERRHMSLSAALLAGDALIADAHRMLRKADLPAKLLDQAEEIFNTAIFEVIGGELLDTEMSFLPKGTVSAHTISRYKTAGYSFIGPITTGALLAEAPEEAVTTLYEFSEILGVGYQLRDDLLGTFGDEAVTGKSTVNDIIEGKQTHLIEQFDRLATPEQAGEFAGIFHHHDADAAALERAKVLLQESGAQAAVEQEIDHLKDEAYSKLTQLALSEASRQLYESLIERCLSRGQ